MNDSQKKMDSLIARGIYLCWRVENFAEDSEKQTTYLKKEANNIRKELGKMR